MQITDQSPSSALTGPQESLYFLHDLAGNRPVYNMPQAFRIRGTLDSGAVETALRHVVARHESLRAEIIDRRESIRSETEFAPEWKDLSTIPAESRESALQIRITASLRPFRLRGELPFRATIFKLTPEEHVILFDLHHIFGDMESLVILSRDFSEAYNRIIRGETLPTPIPEHLEPAPLPNATTQSDAETFWRDRLRDFPHDFELTLDKPRPRFPSFSGETISVFLSSDLTNALKLTARKERCSPFMLVFSAFQALLHRFTGERRFCIGTPFSLRVGSEHENRIAYLVNLLPFPCEVKEEEPFRALLQRVKASCLQLLAHSAVSLREILRELNISIENPKPPLTRIVFQYFPGNPELRLDHLCTERIPVHSHTSKFDLCVSLSETREAICIDLEYDTDIFDRASIERFGASFHYLLQHLANNLSTPVGRIDVITPADRKLLAVWNETATPFPRDKTVHELFEETVVANPEHKAIVFGDRTLTYRELNSFADAIASRLLKHGIKRGQTVGVCVQRSPGLIAALIGILKAGAAFVPFEATLPKTRLEYLFSDSNVSVLLVDEAGSTIAPSRIPRLLVNEQPPDLSPLSLSKERSNSEDLAYIMYTSGSTGNPKGVMVPHRAIVRLVRNNDFMLIRSEDVFLAFAPVSFDASTLEIWAPLLNGATLAIYPPEFRSLDQFQDVLARHQVTCLWLTSGLFNAVVDKNVEALRGVRQLLAGGDVLSIPHVKKALAALPATEIINGYGPTENTTFTCCFRVPKDWPAARSIPIGKPIRNTQVYILDPHLNPVPIGVPGDLYAGGDGLSLGYWNRPELTDAAFIPNPFSSDASARLYRTGDRARFLADGNIEFIGRNDFQVKIRGFRIELGEVENALRSLPAVQDAIVTAQPDHSGGKSLVGYVVRKPGAEVTPGELIVQLGALLPSPACPSSIVFLQSLPIGPTGKVNRNALPKPEDQSAGRTFAAPTNPAEFRLVEIWQSILETKDLGIDDNFFHAGGESLKATRAITQINQAFKCDLSIPQLFMAPTVREMARLLEHSKPQENLAKITRRDSKPTQDSKLDLDSLADDEVDSLLSKLLDNHVGS